MSNNLIDIVDVYKLVWSGRLKMFPHFTWTGEEGISNAIKCTKYLIENILKWDTEQVKQKLNINTFLDNKLGGMMTIIFSSSPYTALNYAYPDTYKPWEMAMCPLNTWDDETSIIATKWLIEEKLCWSEQEMKEKIDIDYFIDYGLQGMLHTTYNGSVKKAITSAYPHVKDEELLQLRILYDYTEEDGIKMIKELIEVKLKWNKDDVKENLIYETFVDNDLENLINKLYDGSPYKAIDTAYPGEYKPWELKKLPKEARSYDIAIKALVWLFEEQLTWTDKDYKDKLNYEVFKQYGLIGILNKYFDCSPYKAFNTIYPDRIKPWQFKKCQQGYWNDDTIKQAITWLVEEQLKIEPRIAPLIITNMIMIDNDLGGILKKRTTQEAIILTYGEAEPYSDIEVYEMVLNEKLKAYPPLFWESEDNKTIKTVIKYIFEKKLSWGRVKICENYGTDFIEDYKLTTIINFLKCSNYDLINIVYPKEFKPWEFKITQTGYWNRDTAIEAVTWTLREKNKIAKENWTKIISYKWLKDIGLEKILRYIKISELKELFNKECIEYE